MTPSRSSNSDRLLAVFERCVDQAAEAAGPVEAREWLEAAEAAADAIAACLNAGNPKREDER